MALKETEIIEVTTGVSSATKPEAKGPCISTGIFCLSDVTPKPTPTPPMPPPKPGPPNRS